MKPKSLNLITVKSGKFTKTFTGSDKFYKPVKGKTAHYKQELMNYFDKKEKK